MHKVFITDSPTFPYYTPPPPKSKAHPPKK